MAWTACIVRIHKKGKVESFLVDTDKFVFGRSPDCEFVIAESQISRQHLGILIKNSQIFLKDLGSSNGSFQGDEQVPEDKVVAYKPDGEVRLGNTQITLSFELVNKRIDAKSLEERAIPLEESEKILSILEAAKDRAKNLHQDYQTLITEARSHMQSEAHAVLEEAKKKGAGIVAEAEGSAQKVVEAAKMTELDIISAARKEELHIVALAQKKAEVEVATIRADANQKQQSAQEAAQQIISEAQKKSQALNDAAQKAALATVQDGQRKSQDLIQEAQRRFQEIIESADRRAAELSLDAQKKSQEALQSAQSTAFEGVYKAKVAAEEVTKQAEMFYATKKKEAEAASQKILHEVQVQVDKLHAAFELKKKDEMDRLEKETVLFKLKIEQDFKVNTERLESDFQLKNKMFEEECSIRKGQLEKDLQNENERIADAKKLQVNLQVETDKYQIELRKTLEDLHIAQAKHKGIVLEIEEAQKRFEEFSSKSEGLTKEESRHQAELTDIVRRKEEELHQIQALKRKFDEEKTRFEKDSYDQRLKIQVELNEVRQKESSEIQRMRLDELDKIDVLRKKTLEEIVKNKDVFKLKLSEKIEARVISLMKTRNSDFELNTFHAEVLDMVQAAIEEQSYELTQGHEADIKQLVAQETTKRKSAFKKVSWISAVVVGGLIGLYIYRGGNIENVLLGKNSAGETAAEEFGREQREQRDAKKFEPPQSDFIKASYTDNVLYTRNYYQVYTDQQLQERWIHDLNRMFSKEFNLEDDTIVKFVAIESTLVNSLQHERDQIVPDFAQLGIDKMRKLEKDAVGEMRILLKDQYRMRKFQSFSEKFWFDNLKDRKPAGD